MPIGGEQIQAAVQIIIEKEKPKFEQQAARRANPLRDGFVSKEQRLVLGYVESGHFIGEVADADPELVIVAVTSGVYPHRSASVAIAIKGHARGRAHLLEGSIV